MDAKGFTEGLQELALLAGAMEPYTAAREELLGRFAEVAARRAGRRSSGWSHRKGNGRIGVQQRMKRAGMRWGESGADAMLALRPVYRNIRAWDTFWRARAA